MRRRTFAALFLLAACARDGLLPVGDTTDVTIRTEKREYHVLPRLDDPITLRFTLANARGVAITLPRCGTNVVSEIQRDDGSRWTTLTSGACAANLDQSPLSLAPGESAPGALIVTTLEGRFRLRVRYTVAGEAGEQAAVSPDFIILGTTQ